MQPHKSRPACITTDATCAGFCNGSSTACFYPVSACGTASCTGSNYQAAGTCGNGACAKPAVQTCTSGETCQASTGKCGCAGTTCGTACVNLATDAKNCGSCGHDCLGGTCSSGLCQVAVVVAGAGQSVNVIAVDATANGSIYYQGEQLGVGLNAYRVNKTANSGTGTPLDVGSSSVEYLGVLGTKLFFDFAGNFGTCGFSASDPTYCSKMTSDLPGPAGAILVPFRSPSPSYIATYNNSSGLTLSWYSTSGTLVNNFGQSSSATVSSFFAFGDTVYWIQDETDSTSNHPNSAVFSVSASALYPVAKRLTASVPPSTYVILDANALSLLLRGPSGLYRVALPAGDAAHAPQWLSATASASGSVNVATEDTSGVYWFELDGSLFGCSPTNCGGTKRALGSGQVGGGSTYITWPNGFYQDASALYWGDWSTGQVMRLAK